jgi:peptidoglycan hydrolase-like protein with peptidoglycan-binding domain
MATRRWAFRVLAALVLLTVGGAGGWAVRATLEPAEDALESPSFTLVAAQTGAVGHSIRLNVSAQWTARRRVANQAAGTITSLVFENGDRARPGDSLYTVDLHPVVVAEGSVPAFRDLSQGVRGDDVAQLQDLLNGLGYQAGEVDGRYDVGVYWAVRAWQRDLGVAVDGTVRRGAVVFVPTLPARLALDGSYDVGSPLGGGEEMVLVLRGSPSFRIVLPEGQAELVEPGMAVEIPRDDGEPWHAEVAEVRRHSDEAGPGGAVAVLAGTGDGPICADSSGGVPLGEESLLPSVIHIVPEVSGTTVPASAIVTTADGEPAVIDADGGIQPVEVVASAQGLAVVEGIEAGDKVQVPGELPADPPAEP